MKIQLIELGMTEDQAETTIEGLINIFDKKLNPVTESVDKYKDKLSVAFYSKIFTQMRKDGWDGNLETADEYFDNVMAKLSQEHQPKEVDKELEKESLYQHDDNVLLPSEQNPEETRKFINWWLDKCREKKEKVGIEESIKLEEEENHTLEGEDTPIEEVEITEESKTIIDYIQDRIGQVISIGEFNTIMQSIFGKFNEIFLQTSEIYNQDPGEAQEVTIWDDDDAYVITYNIVDEMEPTIEITDVEIQ